MAFQARPVVAGDTDTLIYECPAGTEGAAVIGLANVTGAAATYTLKFYSAVLDEEITLASAVAVAANSLVKFAVPLALEGGDQIKVAGSVASSISVFATVTLGAPGPQFSGFTPKGDWASGTVYAVNDVVSIDGTSYASRINGNVGNPPATSPENWVVLAGRGEDGDSIVWAGAYNEATDYAEQEMVRDGGAVWVALQPTSGNAPPALPTTINAYWDLVVRDGDLTAADIGTTVQSHSAVLDATTAPFLTADKTKLNAVGTMANRDVTISTAAPSGTPANGTMWVRV